MKQKFDVTGMSCSACSAHVEKAVSRVPGVDQVQVNLLQNSMVVEYEDEDNFNTCCVESNRTDTVNYCSPCQDYECRD